jgi:hypothetical protein
MNTIKIIEIILTNGLRAEFCGYEIKGKQWQDWAVYDDLKCVAILKLSENVDKETLLVETENYRRKYHC